MADDLEKVLDRACNDLVPVVNGNPTYRAMKMAQRLSELLDAIVHPERYTPIEVDLLKAMVRMAANDGKKMPQNWE